MPTFPADWNLTATEARMLALLAGATGIVSHAELDAAVSASRHGKIGRPLKVVLHYLRAKVKPRRVKILNVHGVGFMLAEESAELLKPYTMQETVAA